VPDLRKYAVCMALAALAAPVAACGEDDARDQIDQARKDIREQAKELEGNIDDLSKQDLREALRDAKDTAKDGGADAKREARQLERKIERELKQRDGGD
jgi:flagellar motility protein MotE (MotC chaperone)